MEVLCVCTVAMEVVCVRTVAMEVVCVRTVAMEVLCVCTVAMEVLYLKVCKTRTEQSGLTVQLPHLIAEVVKKM